MQVAVTGFLRPRRHLLIDVDICSTLNCRMNCWCIGPGTLPFRTHQQSNLVHNPSVEIRHACDDAVRLEDQLCVDNM